MSESNQVMTAIRNKSDLRREAAAHADRLFVMAWGDPRSPRAHIWRPRKDGVGDDPRRMIMTGPDRGLWYDSARCIGGDIFDFVAVHVCGLAAAKADFPRVLAEIAACLGTGGRRPAPPPVAAPASLPDETARLDDALAMIERAATPLAGPALAYWTRARGLSVPPDDLVMRLPRGALTRQPAVMKLPYASAEAVLIMGRDRRGALRAVQRILILPDGRDRDRNRPKFSLGPVKQFPPTFPARADDAALGLPVLAEGPESAGAIWSAAGCATVVCCGGFGAQLSRLSPGDRAVLAIEADARGCPARTALAKAVLTARARGVILALWRLDEAAGSKIDAADIIRGDQGAQRIRRLVHEAAQSAMRRTAKAATPRAARPPTDAGRGDDRPALPVIRLARTPRRRRHAERS